MEKGYIQVYTGNGKGKTTAALGISLRAVCAGKKVFFGQFVKGMKYSELMAVNYLPNFTMHQFGRDSFIFGKPDEVDLELAEKALKEIQNILSIGDYDLVVLDEINIAMYLELFSTSRVIDILKKKKPEVEVILTGRYAPDEIIEIADLVTEMKEIKHYYNDGVTARVGIEK
ncbi:MAG TPA: cob(I)yrinic acid a,c-diamide adenosyltransferase [Clostridiaceae bacterium]